MGRPKRLYPLGKYRLRTPKVVDKEKAYPVELEYTWNRQIIRKTTNVFVKVADWNQNGNQGRGEIRASHGGESKRLNQLLLARVERIDSLLAEYNEKHPNQITADVVSGFLADKPLARRDQGKDFVEFTLERLSSDYARNRIGRSRYENGKSCMNIFQTFLRATRQGTYRSDSIYVGDMTPELLDSYISWRREIKQNSDATINHSLTPILKACAYACEMGMMEPAVNARIQDMRIVTKVSLSEEEAEFDGKSLSKEQMAALLEYYKTCTEPRRKEFLEMFFFAFHACGLRVVDVMTLQWKHIDFARKELRKIMIKTNKRHVIPLTEPALHILQQWREKREGCRYVFNLVKETLDLDDAEALYKARNNATKCINQSLAVVGEQIGLPFSLSMHAARHSFAVFALNKGLSMSVVSRLLGHSSTGTETGTAVIVGISTAIGCAITLIYAAEDLHQKKRIKGKKITETESVQEDMVPDHHKVTLPSRLDTELARKIFDKAIEEEYIIINDDHYEWTLNKVLLAYMCGRIYCEDYPEKTIYDEKMYWMPGRVELFPGTELDKLFNMKDLTQSRHTRKNKAAPTGFEKIDKLFE